MSPRCPAKVFWEDLEMWAQCLRPAGHYPPDVHRDGIRWFDDQGMQIPSESEGMPLR